MYSVMLAAMLTTTSATPEWGCHGCYGCSGYTYCHGCCGGCYCGGYNAFSYCGGCSCYCGGCWGCSGCSCSCAGFFGSGSYLGGPYFDSLGCYGCHGGSYFSSFSCHGFYPSCYGCSCSCSCSGYYVSCSCCGGCCGGTAYVTPPAQSPGQAPDANMKALQDTIRSLQDQNRQLQERLRKLEGGKPKGGDENGGGKSNDAAYPAPAHVVVKLPEDARLFVDGKPCPLTSARREFDTPELKGGQVYYYDLRIEMTRAGRPVTQTKRAELRAGKETVVEFGESSALQTANR
jgi:uncharacterized protein (TIGR03000 family)